MYTVLQQQMIDVAVEEIVSEFVSDTESLEALALNVGRIEDSERITVTQ